MVTRVTVTVESELVETPSVKLTPAAGESRAELRVRLSPRAVGCPGDSDDANTKVM